MKIKKFARRLINDMQNIDGRLWKLDDRLKWLDDVIKLNASRREEDARLGMAVAELEARNSALNAQLKTLQAAYQDNKNELARVTAETRWQSGSTTSAASKKPARAPKQSSAT